MHIQNCSCFILQDIFKGHLGKHASFQNWSLFSSLVAVHGLNPLNNLDHGENTWRALISKKSWLRDFLPQDIPSARIFLFGYNSNVAFSSGNEGVYDQANTLCFTLGGYREDVPHRPIVFIGHSLGGLVIKQVRLSNKWMSVLLSSSWSNIRQAIVLGRLNTRYAPISNATYGLVFFGTPHRGGNNAALGEVIASAVRFFLRKPANDYLNILRHNSFLAEGLRKNFKQLQDNFHVLSFFETLPMGKAGMVSRFLSMYWLYNIAFNPRDFCNLEPRTGNPTCW